MRDFVYAGMFVRQAKKFALLTLVVSFIFVVLEAADFLRASQAKTYSSSKDLNQMNDLLDSYKSTNAIVKQLVEDLVGKPLDLPKPKLYESYDNLVHLNELEEELDLLETKIGLLKKNLVESANSNIDYLIGELDAVISQYEQEGLISKEQNNDNNMSSLFASEALSHLPETLKGLSEASVFMDELSVQMNKPKNKAVAQGYLKKLNIISLLVQKELHSVQDLKQAPGKEKHESKVQEVRADLVRIKENLSSVVSAKWKIDHDLEVARQIFRTEYDKCISMDKELRSLRVQYTKSLLLLCLICVTMPFMILVLADYLSAVLAQGKSQSGNSRT